MRFQSTLSSRRATDSCYCLPICILYFNPRSPHGERPTISPLSTPWTKFQSTLSSRRATISGTSRPTSLAYFNPRSPHGERRLVCRPQHVIDGISIHALLTESDPSGPSETSPLEVFQSTLSSRRATVGVGREHGRLHHFNPRSPHGERPDGRIGQYVLEISIHALLTESDPSSAASPQGSRISIHALLTESDIIMHEATSDYGISIHALLTESDGPGLRRPPRGRISIHALLTESDVNSAGY